MWSARAGDTSRAYETGRLSSETTPAALQQALPSTLSRNGLIISTDGVLKKDEKF